MARTVLTNADWAQLAPLFPKRGPAQHRRKRLEGQVAWQVVADRGYASDALRETIKAKGAEPVIPGRKSRKVPVEDDKHCDGSRQVIEHFFCRLKDHRRVATRDEKTTAKFAAMVMLSCIFVWLQR